MRFLLFQPARRRDGLQHRHGVGPYQGFDSPPPGAALEVLGGVESYPKDPRPQVLDFGDAVLGAPAAEEHFLGDVLRVVRVSQHKPERADQLVADGVEGAQQNFAGRSVQRDLG